jgi:hypothetical protein
MSNVFPLAILAGLGTGLLQAGFDVGTRSLSEKLGLPGSETWKRGQLGKYDEEAQARFDKYNQQTPTAAAPTSTPTPPPAGSEIAGYLGKGGQGGMGAVQANYARTPTAQAPTSMDPWLSQSSQRPVMSQFVFNKRGGVSGASYTTPRPTSNRIVPKVVNVPFEDREIPMMQYGTMVFPIPGLEQGGLKFAPKGKQLGTVQDEYRNQTVVFNKDTGEYEVVGGGPRHSPRAMNPNGGGGGLGRDPIAGALKEISAQGRYIAALNRYANTVITEDMVAENPYLEPFLGSVIPEEYRVSATNEARRQIEYLKRTYPNPYADTAPGQGQGGKKMFPDGSIR